MYFYHGTSAEKAKKIMKEGFKRMNNSTWQVKSKEGFVYFSLAYAPFYAMASGDTDLALIKVSVENKDLYPDEDFVMYGLNKPVYSQQELNEINLEDYKQYWKNSINYLGNASAKYNKVKIVGVRYFDGRKLMLVCDPSITPLNYKFMGEYYKKLSDYIYHGGTIENFAKQEANKTKKMFKTSDIKCQ